MSQAVTDTSAVNDFDRHLQQSSYKQKNNAALQLGVIENASRAQVVVAVRNLALDSDDLHNDGHRTVVDWMTLNYGYPLALATQVAHVAEHLHECPLLFDLFGTGAISWDRFALLSGGLDEKHTDAWWFENESSLSLAACKQIISERSEPVDTKEAFEKRPVTGRRRGSEFQITASYPLDMGLQLMHQIDSEARNADADEETGMYPLTWTARADALAEILMCNNLRAEADRPTIVVYAPAAALDAARYGEHGINAQLEDMVLSSETFQRIACDARYQVARQDGRGHTVGINDQSRNLPRSLRRLVAKRDHGCRFPGCTKTRWTDVHHIVFWSKGGPTNLDNLITLCVAHHHFVHELGWNIEGNPEDGPVQFFKPDGEQLRPPPLRMNRAEYLANLDLLYRDADDLLRSALDLGPP